MSGFERRGADRPLASDFVHAQMHQSPWVGLPYLIFVFVPLLFWREAPARAWWASAATVAVFVPLYFGLFRLEPRWRGWGILPVAALGYALVPLNPGGNTYIIYAVALAGTLLSGRTAIPVAAILVVLMVGQFLWLYSGSRFALGMALLTGVIAAMVLSGVLFARFQERRNAELRLSQDEVRRLARLAERERIGRDLHDLLGHTLSLVALKSELAGKLLARDPAAAHSQIHEVEAVARQALAQVREAVTGIRVAGLDAELAASRLALLSAEIVLDQQVAPLPLDAGTEAVLALALREATTNIIRHSGARRVEVELSTAGDDVQLTISDDGRGGAGEHGHGHGHGLRGMRERVEGAGGRLEIDSPPGAGTRLRIVLPNRRPVEGAVEAAP